jgi:hypothetical protein
VDIIESADVTIDDDKYSTSKNPSTAPYVVLIIDGQTVANQTQSVQHTLSTINRSYDHKIVTCQTSNLAYSQNPMTVSAVIYLNRK